MYHKLYIPPIQKWVFIFLAIAACLLAAFTSSMSAEEKSDGQSAWEFYVAPFVWALAADGNVTVKGIKIGGIAFGSDFAWDAFALIGYRFDLFGKNNASVFAGYRALHQDYTDGSGDDKFKWDVTLDGPVLGLSWTFLCLEAL
jgi:hypothetical protein